MDFLFPVFNVMFLFEEKWQIPHTKEEVAFAQSILQQPFHYIGKGIQSYVFLSNDGKYVLKFLKCQRLRLVPVFEKIPLCGVFKDYRDQKRQEKLQRIESLFTSYSISKKVLSHETQVIFAHLNRTPIFEKTVLLYDKAGFQHEIQIDTVPFVIQRKLDPIFPTLQKLYEQGNQEGLQRRLDQIVDVYVECINKGIRNYDPSLIARNNLGFTDLSACYIDLGSFGYIEKHRLYRNLKKDIKSLIPIYKWLKKRDKAQAEYFKSQLKEIVANSKAL